MPQLPESVTIVCSSNGTTEGLEIDGAEFPWYIDERGPTLEFPADGLARLNLSILVDADRISTRRRES